MTERNFEPIHEVTMYQARCTNCGHIETEYGDYNAWADDGTPVESVTDGGWFNTLGNRYEGGDLLCPACQKCSVCGADDSYDIGDRLVCADHEGTAIERQYELLEDVPREITTVVAVSGRTTVSLGEDGRWRRPDGLVIPRDAHGPWTAC